MVTMPGKHKDTTIAFRPSAWAKAVIEQRASLSGMYKRFSYKVLFICEYCCSWQEGKYTTNHRCATGNAECHERTCHTDSIW